MYENLVALCYAIPQFKGTIRMNFGRLDVAVERDYYPLELRVRIYQISDGVLILICGKLRAYVCYRGRQSESKQVSL